MQLQRTRKRMASDLALGDSLDEILIGVPVQASRDGQRLPMGLLLKRRRANVRHPDLQRAQTLLPQALAMGAHLVA